MNDARYINGNHPRDKILYINGIQHSCVTTQHGTYADSEKFPGVRCSCHSLSVSDLQWIDAGGSVFTSGNHYSRHPPKESP